MKRYESYKDSGVEWIGQVPSHWEIIRGKYSTDILPGFPFDSKKFTKEEGYIGLIRIRDIFSSETEMNYSGKYPQEAVVQNGDVLIGMDGDFNVARWNGEECLLNQRVCKIMHTNIVLSDFMYYSLPWLLKCINDVTYATTVKHLSTFDILRSYFAIPSKNEQQCIVSFLDSKCGEVDKVISTQEKRIALLQELKQSIITHAVTKGLNPNVKMKDSGIEWIGEVPEHWEIIRMKYICEFNGRIGFRGYSQADLVSEGEGAITLSPTNMNDMYVDYNKCSYLSWKKYYESPEIMVKQGDVLLVKTASVGKCSYVKTIPMECTVNPQILVLKKHRQNPMFLTYLFQISLGQTYIELYKAGSTISTLSEDKIGNFRFAFPSNNEQSKIVSYLDKRCASIDTSISKAQREIELLQEYKQSLITEVVTGKRKVC